MEQPMADDHGAVAAALAMVRLMTGWAATGLGLLNLSMGVDTGPGSTDWPYLVFHVVLLITGLTLLALGTLRKRPGRTGYVAGAVVTGAGLLISAPWRGFPFALDAGRFFAADLIFWSCAGFCTLVLVAQFRAAPPPAPVPTPLVHGTTHAEQRAPAPRDENVGGLP